VVSCPFAENRWADGGRLHRDELGAVCQNVALRVYVINAAKEDPGKIGLISNCMLVLVTNRGLSEET
jgi:hypothetical protein